MTQPGAGASSTRASALARLGELSLRVASSLDLQETLEHVADAVLDSVGFQAAVVNLCRDDGVAVAVTRGPQEMREALDGTVQPYTVWAELLRRSRSVGSLCFIDGRADPDLADVHVWVPDLPVSDDPETWHPMDALFAPLHSRDGVLLGILSVDLPQDGRRPDAPLLELLEGFAVQAALAIDRARLHTDLAESAQLFQATFANAPMGMVLIADDGTVQQANQAAARFVGRPDLVGHPCWELVDRRDAYRVRRSVADVAERRQAMEGLVRSPDGRSTAKVVVTPLTDRGRPTTLVLLDDVTAQLQTEAALQLQATTDPLTGLANRAAVHARLEVVAAQAAERPVAVLFCDLDDFKLVNDSFGHAIGDELLLAVSQSLAASLRDGDLAGRVGGDEFVVLLEDVDGPEAAAALAQRILDGVRARVLTGGGSVTPSASVGIAYADEPTTADALLAEADAALYEAKALGRGRWQQFTPELRTRARELLVLREELLHAVENEEFCLEYQPIIELATGITCGFEALLRWRHPRRGLLLPEAFLKQVQGGELAAPVTDWVFERAIADAATWPEQHGIAPRVSVNVAPSQLHRSDLPERVERLLATYGLPADQLCVEVTEDAVVEGARELSTLAELRALGVHLAVDDFGSGYAGLLSLRDVPADVVKLDRAFTDQLLSDAVSRHVVEVAVELCRRLGREIVAEGVETPEQAEAVRALGVRFGQGIQFGRPAALIPAERRRRRTRHDPPSGDRRLQARRFARALAGTSTAEQVGELVVAQLLDDVGCDGGSLVLLAEDAQVLLTRYARGYPAEVVNRFASFPLAASLPLSSAVRTGTAVWIEAVEAVQAVHDAGNGRHVAMVALPLLHEGRALGGLGASWTSPVLLDAALRRHLELLAAEVAAHLARLQAAAAVG